MQCKCGSFLTGKFKWQTAFEHDFKKKGKAIDDSHFI